MKVDTYAFTSLKVVLSLVQMSMFLHRKQIADGMVCQVDGYEAIFYDDKCYIWFADEKWNRSYSKAFCSDRGLELPRIDDFRSTVNAWISKAYFKVTFRDNASLWLGAKHHGGSKHFRWDDNNEVVAMDVLSGEQRRNSSGDCVVLTRGLFAQTASCGDLAYTMCMAISPRYFGKDEAFKCNCRGAFCSFYGDCWKAGGRCKPGWFGKICQKRDLLFDVENPLTDFDDQTCVTNTTNPQTFPVAPPNYLFWIRVVLKNKGQLDSFKVDVVSDNKVTRNIGKKVLVIDDKVVDIWCGMNLTLVKRVILRWDSLKTLCSVHVFGGLNVALKQTASQSSTYQNYGPQYAVDGEHGMLSPSAITRVEDPVQKWTLEMASLKLVMEVVVYLKSPQTQHMMELNLTLEFESPTSNRIGRNSDHSFLFKPGEIRVSILSGTLEVVNKLKIGRLDDEVAQGNLDLSEVEVYGVCAPPYFGILCDKICSKNCKALRCHFNGECYECVPGTSGRNCQPITTEIESTTTTPKNETRVNATRDPESTKLLETTGKPKTKINSLRKPTTSTTEIFMRETITEGFVIETSTENFMREALISDWTTTLPLDPTNFSNSSTTLEREPVTIVQVSAGDNGKVTSETSYFTILFVVVGLVIMVGVTWTVIKHKMNNNEEAAITPETTEESSEEEEVEEEEGEEESPPDASADISGSPPIELET